MICTLVGVSSCRSASEIPRLSAVGGSLHWVRGQVRINLRRPGLPMAEDLCNYVKAFARARRYRRKALPKIVDSRQAL